MNLLLDANVLIWLMEGNPQLGRRTQVLLDDAHNTLYVSVFTLFEIELKQSIGKLKLSSPIADFLDQFEIKCWSSGPKELSKFFEVELPHKDPFDRAVAGTAYANGWILITSDRVLLAADAVPTRSAME
jgi:PIN domain nuclease of toxin-antitoxin system